VPRGYEPKLLDAVPLYRAAYRYTMRDGKVVDVGHPDPDKPLGRLMARQREHLLLHPPGISAGAKAREWRRRLRQRELERKETLAQLEHERQRRELQKAALAFGAIDADEHEQTQVSDDLWQVFHSPPIEDARMLELMQTQMAWQHERRHPHTREQWEALVHDIRLAFGELVKSGTAKLYARKGVHSEPLKRLGADVWSRLKVDDWKRGNGTADDGTKYLDICVQVGGRGRPAKSDLGDDLERRVFDWMASHGGNLTLANIERKITEELEKDGVSFAPSTIRKYAHLLRDKHRLRQKAGK